MPVSAKRRPHWPRVALAVAVYGGLLAVGHWGSGWLVTYVDMAFAAGGQTQSLHVMIAGVALYAILLAIPFVPGIEISLGLLMLFGPMVAPAIYVATVAALALSCLIGKILPIGLIAALFGSLGLRRAKNLIESLQPLNTEQRFEVLLENAPKRIVPMLLKHRYIAIMVALNLPGNTVIGGGGGIALLAGISGLFTVPRFVVSVALAALPVPLTIMLTGGWN